MAYFNHAFQKTILALDGQITAEKKMWELNEAAVDESTGAQKAMMAIVATEGEKKDTVIKGDGQTPFIIAGTTLRPKDKIGKFMAGFQALNKTKKINPKYVNKLYYVTPQVARQEKVYFGNTDKSTCESTYECGVTYYLQLDIKGNVVASYLMHNYHNRIPAYVSCCNKGETTTLDQDSVEIYYEWAKYIKNDPLTDGIIDVFVVADNKYYSLDGTTEVEGITVEGDFKALETAIAGGEIAKAGIVIAGAYFETKFGACTFNKRDNQELQPLEIYLSRVDVDGNPCFEACEPVKEVGLQATRTGRSLLDEVILQESYNTRWLHDDFRKREVEGEAQLLSMIDINAQYPGIYLLHSVPRFSNPSGTFDNDQYLIQIIVKDGDLEDIVSALETATGLTAEEY